MTDYNLYVNILIPLLLGSAVGILYAMFISKDGFRPRKIMDEHGGYYYLGWISYLITGGISGIFCGYAGKIMELGETGIFISSMVGAVIFCFYSSYKRQTE